MDPNVSQPTPNPQMQDAKATSPVTPPVNPSPQNPQHNTIMKSKMVVIFLLVVTMVIVGIAIYKLVGGFSKPVTDTTSYTPTPTRAKVDLFLTLETPTEGMVVTNNQLLVKGKTLPNTVVVLYTDTKEESVESNQMGDFEGTIMLDSGINSVTVTAFGEDGSEKSIEVSLVYDEEAK